MDLRLSPGIVVMNLVARYCTEVEVSMDSLGEHGGFIHTGRIKYICDLVLLIRLKLMG